MIISASALLVAKGALFISKTAALKAALVKVGAYTVAHVGAASVTATATALATTGIQTCMIAGLYVTVKNMSERAFKGSKAIVDGLVNNDYTCFSDGIYQLARAGMSASSLMSTVNDFIDGIDASLETKISLKKTLKSVEFLIIDTLENKSLPLLKEVENILKSNGYSEDSYNKEINSIYFKHTSDLYNDYEEVLGRGGRIYSDICNLNKRCGIRIGDEYDHYLAYCIGGWLVTNKGELSCLKYKTEKQVAHDITNQIFEYLKNYGLT